MFIERSTRRIRAARTLFVLVGVLPCLVLVAWSVQRRSPGHRQAVAAAWQRSLGVPIEVGRIEHLRPGVIRAHDCRIGEAREIVVPVVDVEASAGEVRLRIDTLACDAAAMRLAGELAAGWIGQAARFPQDCIVEVRSLDWRGAATEATADVRVECVAHGGFRAVRVVRRDVEGDSLRIVRGGGAESPIEVEARVATLLPVELAAAVAGWPSAGLESATFSGEFIGRSQAGRWSGTGGGRIDGVDLAACTSLLPGRARGRADLDLRRLDLRDGRVVACDLGVVAGPGEVDRILLESLVTTLGCRPGTGLHAASAAVRGLTRAAADIRLDHRGIEVVGGSALDGALVVGEGVRLIEPPVAAIPPERLAWLVAAPGAVYVPSSGAGAWLMSVLPDPAAALDEQRRAERVDGDGRGDF